ncbi:MAG TPA: GDP-mannose 4,6-dehydratase [Longimicrobiaceae bacterium]
MRVLVTGAAGFVGLHLVRALADEGHEVYAGALEPPASTSGDAVAWRPLEMGSAASIAALLAEAQPEWVFHLAARSSVGESVADPLDAWDVNATGTLRLLGALPPEARLVFASSAQVYGLVPESEQPIRETCPLRPVNAYAATKAAAEMPVLQATLAGRIRGVVARSFNSSGPGQDTRFALPSFARQLALIRRGECEPVLRVGNLEARRDFLDVRDAVRAYLALAEGGVPGCVYNVCSGRAFSMRELLDVLVELSGTGARVEVDPARVRPVDVPLMAGDGSALRALGWEPRIPMRQTLADLLEHEERAISAPAGAA